MEIWTAFLFGLVGSAHCLGMCGALALALPIAGNSKASFVVGRIGYNAGRISTYVLLGALFGAMGQTIALAGLQRWLSLGAGLAILVGFAASSRYALHRQVIKAIGLLKAKLSALMRKRTLPAFLLLGALNGLLPCGLVYVACAGAVATGGLLEGMQYMFLFGLGTVPVMLGVGLAGQKVQPALRFRFQKLVPACVVALGLLLVLRGMSLGIPYVSPDLSSGQVVCPACHPVP
jgi:sulfite exporter TauE/SafE